MDIHIIHSLRTVLLLGLVVVIVHIANFSLLLVVAVVPMQELVVEEEQVKFSNPFNMLFQLQMVPLEFQLP